MFGSAATECFDPARSDVDFLVVFEQMPPAEYAEAYFGLLEGLEELFSLRVDLVTEASLENPYLRQAIEASHTELYAACPAQVSYDMRASRMLKVQLDRHHFGCSRVAMRGCSSALQTR